eukprot:6212116-Prymnesium_polylepis.1
MERRWAESPAEGSCRPATRSRGIVIVHNARFRLRRGLCVNPPSTTTWDYRGGEKGVSMQGSGTKT